MWPNGIPPAGITHKEDFGDPIFSISHREKDGRAEHHQMKPMSSSCRAGKPRWVYGGQAIDPQPAAPCEIEGSEIKGGTGLTVKAGDVIHIPHPAYRTSFSSLQGKRPIKIAENHRSEHVSNMCLTCLMFRIE